MTKYTMCGGCGATKPEDRCLGCLHNFGGGSWDTDNVVTPAPSVKSLALTITRALGSYGSAYDPPGPQRAYTYEHQPSNQPAYRLGCALAAAVHVKGAGDAIDGGLYLLKALQALGFGVFEIEPKAVETKAPPDISRGIEARCATYEDILRVVCGHLELPQSESGPADDVRLYDRALEAMDEYTCKADADLAENTRLRFKAEAQVVRLKKALTDARALLFAEYGSNGRVVGVSHEMDGLRRMVAIFDAALKSEGSADV